MSDELEEFRQWLRMNGDYNVRIDPWAAYGCWHFSIYYLLDHIGTSFGATLEKRIKETIEICETHQKGLPK